MASPFLEDDVQTELVEDGMEVWEDERREASSELEDREEDAQPDDDSDDSQSEVSPEDSAIHEVDPPVEDDLEDPDDLQ